MAPSSRTTSDTAIDGMPNQYLGPIRNRAIAVTGISCRPSRDETRRGWGRATGGPARGPARRPAPGARIRRRSHPPRTKKSAASGRTRRVRQDPAPASTTINGVASALTVVPVCEVTVDAVTSASAIVRMRLTDTEPATATSSPPGASADRPRRGSPPALSPMNAPDRRFVSDIVFLLRRRVRTPEYLAYMASAEWRQTAAAAKSRAGYRCERCGATGRLEVHHRTYDRLGREWPEDLQVLCPSCHAIARDEPKRSSCAGSAGLIQL